LAEAARFCRAALIQRVPEPVTRILRRLTPGDLTQAPLMVIDTHALHAFEFAAGVFIDTPQDSPFFEGAAQQLTLASTAPVAPEAFLRLLRQADRSYETLPGAGPAESWAGQIVATPTRTHYRMTSPASRADERAIGRPAGGARFSRVVIGHRGDPAHGGRTPRLALHKLRLSQRQDRTRGNRDRAGPRRFILPSLISFFFCRSALFPPEWSRLVGWWKGIKLAVGWRRPGQAVW
jgi:hypothetical protein